MAVIKDQGIKNTILNYIGIAIGFLNLIVIQPYFLTPEEIGLTRVLFSFSLLLATFFPFGLSNITTKYFPLFKDKEKHHSGFFSFMLAYLLLGFLICALLIFVFKENVILLYADKSPLFVEFYNYVFPFTFILGLINVFNVYCFSLFKSTVPSFLNDILVRILTILIFSLYFLKWIDLTTMISTFVGVYGVQLVLLLFYIFYIDRPKLFIKNEIVRSKHMGTMMKYGFVLSLASFSSLGIKYLDSVILAKYVPLSIVGIYAVAAFIPTVIEAPVNALEKIANAKISTAMSKNDWDQVNQIYQKSSKYFLAIGCLLFLLINSNISDLLSFLPDIYSKAEPIILIISFGSLFNMATGVNNAIIFNSDKYYKGTILLYVLLGVTIFSNILFIKFWGIAGAALATALTGLLYNLSKCVLIYAEFKILPFTKVTYKIIFASAITGAVCYFINADFLPLVNIFLKAVIVTSLYFGLFYFLGLFREFDEIKAGKLFSK